jgi:hypothetical protein
MSSKETLTQEKIPFWSNLQLQALDLYCRLCDRCLTLLQKETNNQSVEEQIEKQIEEVKRKLKEEERKEHTDPTYLHQPMTY